MKTPQPKQRDRAEGTESQERQGPGPADKESKVELGGDELEERIAPRLAQNHNETLLVER